MRLKCRHSGLLLVALTITLHCKGSASSPSEENLNSQGDLHSGKQSITQPGNLCLDLPEIDNPSFRTLIEKKCYVDKTEYLNKLASRKTKNYFLSRPRRFGKTLLVDTMEEFFRGEKELFKDTEFSRRRPSFTWTKYPTIRLDLSKEISHVSESKFKSSLMDILTRQAMSHNIHLISRTVPGSIGELIEQLNAKYNSKVTILIDEYDSPYIKSYARGDMNETEKILGVLQSFFSTLKGNYKSIHFCFVTGITRLALSDFLSGFVTDLTMDEDFAGIVGFTEIELHKYFGNQIKKVATEMKREEESIFQDMQKWHDGFQFSTKCETLYSPCSVIGYLKTKAVSTTSWSDTGGPSQFLVQKLEEFPKEALKLILEHQTKRRTADGRVQTSKLLTAHKRELTGKINYEVNDFRSLVALLFHSGYLSIESHNPKTDVFTLRFSNLELEKDYSRRVADIIIKVSSECKEASIVSDLEAFRWESFIERLDAFNHGIPYQITTNQTEGLEAWFQFILRTILDRANVHNELEMEDSTSKGRADIVYSNQNTLFIFEPKMSHNDEHPVYECKEKYRKKYLFDSNKGVVCIGLKFLYKGQVESWGVANFSYEGKLLTESGTIRLTIQLSSEEEQNILNEMKKNPQCPIEPEKVIEFLKKIGPTTEDQLVLVNKVSEDTKTLCIVLQEIKQLVQPNLRYIINSVVKAVEETKESKEEERKKKEKIRLEKNPLTCERSLHVLERLPY